MIHCGDPSYGGSMFAYPDCGELKLSPFRCKSRFCPTCGNMYNLQRSFAMSCKVVYDWAREGIPKVYGFDAKVPVGIFDGECEVDFREICEQMKWMYEEE